MAIGLRRFTGCFRCFSAHYSLITPSSGRSLSVFYSMTYRLFIAWPTGFYFHDRAASSTLTDDVVVLWLWLGCELRLQTQLLPRRCLSYLLFTLLLYFILWSFTFLISYKTLPILLPRQCSLIFPFHVLHHRCTLLHFLQDCSSPSRPPPYRIFLSVDGWLWGWTCWEHLLYFSGVQGDFLRCLAHLSVTLYFSLYMQGITSHFSLTVSLKTQRNWSEKNIVLEVWQAKQSRLKHVSYHDTLPGVSQQPVKVVQPLVQRSPQVWI